MDWNFSPITKLRKRQSHALRVRGLKQRCYKSLLFAPWSHALRVRGVKRRRPPASRTLPASHALRVRGLKQLHSRPALFHCDVAHSTRAWIETTTPVSIVPLYCRRTLYACVDCNLWQLSVAPVVDQIWAFAAVTTSVSPDVRSQYVIPAGTPPAPASLGFARVVRVYASAVAIALNRAAARIAMMKVLIHERVEWYNDASLHFKSDGIKIVVIILLKRSLSNNFLGNWLFSGLMYNNIWTSCPMNCWLKPKMRQKDTCQNICVKMVHPTS